MCQSNSVHQSGCLWSRCSDPDSVTQIPEQATCEEEKFYICSKIQTSQSENWASLQPFYIWGKMGRSMSICASLLWFIEVLDRWAPPQDGISEHSLSRERRGPGGSGKITFESESYRPMEAWWKDKVVSAENGQVKSQMRTLCQWPGKCILYCLKWSTRTKETCVFWDIKYGFWEWLWSTRKFRTWIPWRYLACLQGEKQSGTFLPFIFSRRTKLVRHPHERKDTVCNYFSK